MEKILTGKDINDAIRNILDSDRSDRYLLVEAIQAFDDDLFNDKDVPREVIFEEFVKSILDFAATENLSASDAVQEVMYMYYEHDQQLH